MHLQDTAVLVTGGASGLGEATVLELARQGARVAILDINRERAEALAKLVDGIALHCDVTDPASAAGAIAAARARGTAWRGCWSTARAAARRSGWSARMGRCRSRTSSRWST